MKRLITNSDRSYIAFYDYPHRIAKGKTIASVLFCHATGFHGRVFNKVVSFLDKELYPCYTFDQRGHGLSPWPDDAPVQELSDWDGFGEDALAMSAYVAQDEPQNKIIGVGHSQGATALILAALQRPERFSALILYEPVVFPKLWRNLSKVFYRFSESPLAQSSRKRRVEFGSGQEAFKNFAGKPPMNRFNVEVLRDYLKYGSTWIN